MDRLPETIMSFHWNLSWIWTKKLTLTAHSRTFLVVPWL